MEIIKGSLADLSSILQLFKDSTKHLRQEGIYQWDIFYPNRFIIKTDIKSNNLFVLIKDSQTVGAITLNNKSTKQHRSIRWANAQENALLIHRLVVHPEMQGNGFGRELLRFSEEAARINNCGSIHLDVYSGNKAAISLYEKHGYVRRGEITYPFRCLPYFCYEKTVEVTSSSKTSR